jgi:hypothetical protein
VTRKLTTNLNANHLLPPHQSAYRQNHSTETALLKICRDALLVADHSMVTLVVLLDLSTAFDTVNYETLLDTLEVQFGITGQALNWHRSYLSGRTYCVVIGDATSDKIEQDCGLPQGSSLIYELILRKSSSVTRYPSTGSLMTHNSANTCLSTTSLQARTR